ncbi:hypothetical protein [Companilactobacillus zhongbaensis]|uniref:hypothetical protein n=1 Tax=Companilactobacillus zhongbaensis TaxID=2486009 RepID=UPI000F780E3C|nr:hypothetical protein [Companilactobacillus zhongbaensis]
MSLLKKAVVTISALALAAPMVANGTAGIAAAALAGTENAKTENVAKDNSSLKTPLRNANSIFNLKLDKQKDGYVLVTNIAASGNNVIQKGEQLVVDFDTDNVDLDSSSVINQKGSLPYSVKKNADKGTVTFTFNETVHDASYSSAIGVATKNVYDTTPVKANFEGAAIKVANNKLTSKWHPQATTSSYTSTTSQQSYSTQQATSQYASTQAASSYSTSSYTTSYQQAGTTTSTQAGTTSQQGENSYYQPTFDEAEKAVMGQTTIKVVGDLTTDTETSANQATTSDDSSTVTNNALGETTTSANHTTSANNQQATTTENSNAQGSSVTTSQPVKTDTSQNTEKVDNSSDNATQTATQNVTSNTASGNTASNNATTTATVDQPAQSKTGTSTQVQAGTTPENVIQTPDGKASDPQATLDEVLKNNDTDPNNADNTGETKSYQKNETFEGIRQDIENKVPEATYAEKAEIVKAMPGIWSYIAKADTQDQVFNFATLLSTGRTAYTTINGVADPNGASVLQQQMPSLLKAFGENMAEDAFDKAMDIDVLLDSQVYQDYINGKSSATDSELDASEAWNAMKDHITVEKVDSNTDTSGATNLKKRTYNPTATLNSYAASALAEQNAKRADNLVINKTTSSNEATEATDEQAPAKDGKANAALFSKMEKDMGDKMKGSSEMDKAEILGSLPGILNDLSSKTDSSDTTGTTAKYLQKTTDGNQYLITLNTQPISGSSDKYLANLPQVFNAFGDSLKDGDFDQPINNQLMLNSQVYKDYLDGKYVPDALVQKKTVDNKDDLLPAILLAILAVPLAALAMGVVAIVTSPIWVPLALITWGIVFAITALPVVFIYTVLGALIIPSLILFPIMLVVSLFTAPLLLIANLIPIINLITVPISLVVLALTFIPGFIVLTFIPMVLLAGAIVLAGLIVPLVMTIGLVIAQVIAGIISLLTGGLLAMLLPITALLGLVIAGLFSLLGLIGFALIAGLIMGVVLGLIIAGFAVLTVVAGGFAGVIGLGLIAGMAVVLLGYLAFMAGGMLAGMAIFLILLLLMPQFLVLNFLLWFIGFGFMALILTDLALPSLYLAVAIGGLMMLFFIPGLLIALSWPFWMGLVLAISIPIVEIAFVIALPFSFIPLFGWIADAIVGVIILIQAIALAISIVVPIVIGVLMMTVGIIGFDIAAAAALVIELIKKKEVAERIHVNIKPNWNRKIRPVGFWTNSDPLSVALA